MRVLRDDARLREACRSVTVDRTSDNADDICELLRSGLRLQRFHFNPRAAHTALLPALAHHSASTLTRLLIGMRDGPRFLEVSLFYDEDIYLSEFGRSKSGRDARPESEDRETRHARAREARTAELRMALPLTDLAPFVHVRTLG